MQIDWLASGQEVGQKYFIIIVNLLTVIDIQNNILNSAFSDPFTTRKERFNRHLGDMAAADFQCPSSRSIFLICRRRRPASD